MFDNVTEKIAGWLRLGDGVETRKPLGHEFEVGAQVQRKIEIKMKKPDPWNYQGKVRFLRIEKKEDKATLKAAAEMLAVLEYNLDHNADLRKIDEGRKAEDLEHLAAQYDNAIRKGWLSEAGRLSDEISGELRKLQGENSPSLMKPLPGNYSRSSSRFDVVRKGPTLFEIEKETPDGKHSIKWNTVYHYELVRPRRRQPKSFSTVQDIFPAADHVRYDQTQKGKQARNKLYNVVALFCWVALTATTEIVTLTGGQVTSSQGFNLWILAVGEGIFFLFLMYFLARAIMNGMHVFTVELKPITYSPTATGPIPAIVDDEKLLDTLLEMADARKENVIEIGETLYSFQEEEFAEMTSEIRQLKAEKTILEQKIKENQEHEDLLTDTGRVKVRKVTPKWAYGVLAAFCCVSVFLGLVMVSL